MNNSKENKENTDNINLLENQNKIFDKIIECILKGHKLNRGDLKLFGITEPQLTKRSFVGLFEEKVVTTENKKEKHSLNQ